MKAGYCIHVHMRMMDLLRSLIFPSHNDLNDKYKHISSSRHKRRILNTMAPPATSKETVLVERLASPKGSHSEWNKQTPINYSNENKDPRPGVSTVHPAFSSTELQDIDDFERLHPYIPKATPAPVLKPTLASDPGRLVPIARVTKGNSNNVVKIHHLCDQRGLVPYFDCSGDPLAGGFIGKVEFGDQSVETTDLWPNKKAAKEAAAELAVERFEAVKEQLVGMKRKKVAGGPGDEDRGVSVDRSENWIALLNGTSSFPSLSM